VIDDPDIYRAAKLMIEQHGDDAAVRAAERADHFLEGATLGSGGVASHPSGD
jgi:hypothetical protein